VEVIRYDLTIPANYCEYQRYGITHIPGMLYIDKSGKVVEVTDSVIEKPELKQKLDNLLARQ
jgi:hypothetical protein